MRVLVALLHLYYCFICNVSVLFVCILMSLYLCAMGWPLICDYVISWLHYFFRINHACLNYLKMTLTYNIIFVR